jgi:hypothetical protein
MDWIGFGTLPPYRVAISRAGGALEFSALFTVCTTLNNYIIVVIYILLR